MTCNCLDEYKPILLLEVDYYIRHFAVGIHRNAELSQTLLVKDHPLLIGVSNIQNSSSVRESLAKLRNYFANKYVLSARRKGKRLSIRELDRNSIHFAFLRVFPFKRLDVYQMCS